MVATLDFFYKQLRIWSRTWVAYFRLNHEIIDIFGSDSDQAFAGLLLIVCGDFYQLPPVHGAPI